MFREVYILYPCNILFLVRFCFCMTVNKYTQPVSEVITKVGSRCRGIPKDVGISKKKKEPSDTLMVRSFKSSCIYSVDTKNISDVTYIFNLKCGYD